METFDKYRVAGFSCENHAVLDSQLTIRTLTSFFFLNCALQKEVCGCTKEMLNRGSCVTLKDKKREHVPNMDFVEEKPCLARPKCGTMCSKNWHFPIRLANFAAAESIDVRSCGWT